VVTEGIDPGKRALHWIVRAWKQVGDSPATGYTIDYGVQDVHGTKPGSDEGVDQAILRALHERRDAVLASPYVTEDGQPIATWLSLIDSAWKRDAVFQFCSEAGIGYYPAIGHGRSSGCTTTNFYEPVKSNPNKIMGWQYFSTTRTDGGWIIHANADHWKGWEHDRWMQDSARPGALMLYGRVSDDPDHLSIDQRGHFTYAHHICAEVEVEEPVKGTLKRYWKNKSDNNHWLDASYRCDVAAAMCGLRLFGMPPPPPAPSTPDEHWRAEQAAAFAMSDGSPYLVTER
jgi:hypothetical protein